MGRGKAAATLRLIEMSAEILDEIQPCSVRAVCYRLFTAGLIPSMAKAETNKVSRLLTQAREDGTIPWSSIVDDTRRPERAYTFADGAEYLRHAARNFARDHWTMQETHVEVWSEKNTVTGTLAPVTEELGVTVRVMHGHGSATAVYDVAEESLGMDKPFVALYVGDYDPSGMHMSEVDLPERITRYGGEVKVLRVALTADDLASISTFHVAEKQKDPRFVWFIAEYGQTCAELDALSPAVLRDRVRAAIMGYVDRAAWARSERAGKAEAESIKAYMHAWAGVGDEDND